MCIYMYIYSPLGGLPLNPLKFIILINLGAYWVYQTIWRHTDYHCVKFSLWETLCSPSYEDFWISGWPSYFNIGYMKVCEELQALGGISSSFS